MYSGYAGFWKRFLARFIDGLIYIFFFGIMGVAIALMSESGDSRQSEMMVFVYVCVGLCVIIGLISYEIGFVVTKGGTLGKLALNLRVVNEDNGGNLTIGHAIKRYFFQTWIPLNNIPYVGVVFSLVTLIGCVMVGFDDEKRALHDRLAGTRVVKQ